MKTLKLGFLVLGLSVLISSMADAKKMKDDDISDMIIEGENRLRVSAPHVDSTWEVDYYKDIPAALHDQSIVGELKPPPIKSPAVPIPEKLDNKKGATPWLHEILQPPVITLNLESPIEDKKATWVFLVKNSEGKTFHRVKKKGVIPEQIVWDGMGKGNEPLHVGYDYTYSVSFIDEAGNPQRFAGDAFRIDSFHYRQSGDEIMAVNPEILFVDASSLKISDAGNGALTEIKDNLRRKYGRKIEIRSYDHDQKFALARSKIVRDYLAEALDIPPHKIEAEGLPARKGDGYSHVDIIAK